MEGGMWDESETLYPLLGARPVQGDLYWAFPSGAKVRFAHMQYESDKFDYQGAQIPLICFDQLEHFTENQFFYMLSRNRSVCGVRPYVRASCNPDPDSWLATFIDWWIDPETGFVIPERSAVVRWFIRLSEKLIWADSAGELRQQYGERVLPKSVTFIPASVYDNKILLQKDPGYLANLEALPPIDEARLLKGNWKVRAAAGKVFNRGWFEIVDAIPAGGIYCRGWDFASTQGQMKGNDPDYTASVMMCKVGDIYYILDCTAEQIGPAVAEMQFVNTSKQDHANLLARRIPYMVRWEIEPGAMSVRYNRQLVVMLAGLDCAGSYPSGEKLVRAKGLARQAVVGNVKLLRGPWNEMWLRHMHGQPDLPHEDVMDASSLAFNSLTAGVKRKASQQQG
jgi:predicted phage terminase large subunit-like protein